jgi:hypothetical protein
VIRSEVGTALLDNSRLILAFYTDTSTLYIRALSAHSAAKFNILPGRWQHVWLVAIVPPKRWGEKWTEMTATQHGGTFRH